MTSNYLFENFLYPFKLESNSTYFAIGICAKKTNLNSNSAFACDALRVGYFINSGGVSLASKGTSIPNKSKNLEKDEIIAILVHKGSYDKNNAVQVSFFHQSKDGSLNYQFTLINPPVSKDGKIYAFFGCSSLGCQVRALKAKYFNNKNLKFNNIKDYKKIF
jgi:hypothetical protein